MGEAVLNSLRKVIAESLNEASIVFKEMAGIDVRFTLLDLKLVDMSGLEELLMSSYNEVVAIVSTLVNGSKGYIVLVLSPDVAIDLTKNLFSIWLEEENPSEEDIEEALREFGNILFGKVTASLSKLGKPVKFSVPEVVMDVMVSVLESVLAEILMSADKVLLVDLGIEGIESNEIRLLIVGAENMVTEGS